MEAGGKVDDGLKTKVAENFGDTFEMTFRDDASLDIAETAKQVYNNAGKGAAGAEKAKEFFYGQVNIGKFKDESSDLSEAWRKLKETRKLSNEAVAQLKEKYTPHHDTTDGIIQFVNKDVHSIYKHFGGNAARKHGLLAETGNVLVGAFAASSMAIANDTKASSVDHFSAGAMDAIDFMNPLPTANVGELHRSYKKGGGQGLFNEFMVQGHETAEFMFPPMKWITK